MDVMELQSVEALAAVRENKTLVATTTQEEWGDLDARNALVRRAPLVLSGEVLVRSRAGMERLAPLKRRWIELRGGAIIICRDAKERGQVLQVEEVQGALFKCKAAKVIVSFAGKRKSRGLELRFDSQQTAERWHAELEDMASSRVVKLDDFEVISPIGKGGSGRVFLVRDKVTQELFALKVIGKWDALESATATRHAVDERFALEIGQNHPFIMKLVYAFQSETNLFLVSEFCGGGDLHSYLRRVARHHMSEQSAKYMLAEVVLALEFLHEHGIVYRDLKPENLLISSDGHVVLGDFGLAKKLAGGSFGRTHSFCGTREFLSPEVVSGTQYGVKVDSWAFGILMYRAIAGYTPFFRPNQSRADLFRRIRSGEITYGPRFSPEAVSLLTQVITKTEQERLSMVEIKAHPFFADVDWDKVRARGYDWRDPEMVHSEGLSNFNVDKLRDLSVGESQDSDFLSKLSAGFSEMLPITDSNQNNIIGYGYDSRKSSWSRNSSRFSSSSRA
ncbi:RAC family serine/threonine-protein kinase-like [Porphyridium purpureum]|uniref:RAC family serine/threonine-protein kinase-like n=1 Tax=Porphyridium purpureum TaxID=35688 RepID=A0A5J4Z7T0_PORPP|nr:RAC family serine/threonine-protein kinase-like [Porphyridium purpureum]|eukprot:POR5764..scf295_1